MTGQRRPSYDSVVYHNRVRLFLKVKESVVSGVNHMKTIYCMYIDINT